jgi:hypothetical protein
LESGDLEARRAGEIIAWGGAKRSPRYAKAAFSAESATASLSAAWFFSGIELSLQRSQIPKDL